MILLYDYTVPTFFSVILRLDKPVCLLKDIPCSAVSAEEHMKGSWPSSWSGLFSLRLVWWANLKHIIPLKYTPCWIFRGVIQSTNVMTHDCDWYSDWFNHSIADSFGPQLLFFCLATHLSWRALGRMGQRGELSKDSSNGRCQIRAELKKTVAARASAWLDGDSGCLPSWQLGESWCVPVEQPHHDAPAHA